MDNSTRNRLFELSMLDRDWNGYDAKPPNHLAIEMAGRIVNVLDELRFEATRLGASAEGGVFVSFRSGSRYADIECFNTGETLTLTSDSTCEDDVDIKVREISSDIESIRSALLELQVHVSGAE